jgi:hypothetical protein
MDTAKEKRSGMEIETTIKDSLEKLKRFPPDTRIKIIIKELRKRTDPATSKWKRFAQEIDEESPLDGASEEANQFSKKFRDTFAF